MRTLYLSGLIALVVATLGAEAFGQSVDPLRQGQLLTVESPNSNDQAPSKLDTRTHAGQLDEWRALERSIQTQTRVAIVTSAFLAGSFASTSITYLACLRVDSGFCGPAWGLLALNVTGFLVSYVATMSLTIRAYRSLDDYGGRGSPALVTSALVAWMATFAVSASVERIPTRQLVGSTLALYALVSPMLQAISNQFAFNRLTSPAELSIAPQLEHPGLHLAIRW